MQYRLNHHKKLTVYSNYGIHIAWDAQNSNLSILQGKVGFPMEFLKIHVLPLVFYLV